MNLKAIIDIISFIVAIGLGVYQLYTAGKRLRAHVNGRKDFLEMNKATMKDEFLEHKAWVVFYAVAAIVFLVVGIYVLSKNHDVIYAAASFAMTAVFISFAMECFVTRRSWYYEDGFFFESKFYRYRSIAYIGARKGMMPSYDVRFHALPDMIVTRKMGEKLMEKEAEWKAAKKEKKNK